MSVRWRTQGGCGRAARARRRRLRKPPRIGRDRQALVLRELSCEGCTVRAPALRSAAKEIPVYSSRNTYRGYLITTRSVDAAALFAGTVLSFSGLFRVDSAGGDEESWQEFPRGVFGTREGAMACALMAAKRSID